MPYVFDLDKKDPVAVAVGVSAFLREKGVRVGVIAHTRDEREGHTILHYAVLGEEKMEIKNDPVYVWVEYNGRTEVTVYETVGSNYNGIVEEMKSMFKVGKQSGILPPS